MGGEIKTLSLPPSCLSSSFSFLRSYRACRAGVVARDHVHLMEEVGEWVSKLEEIEPNPPTHPPTHSTYLQLESMGQSVQHRLGFRTRRINDFHPYRCFPIYCCPYHYLA